MLSGDTTWGYWVITVSGNEVKNRKVDFKHDLTAVILYILALSFWIVFERDEIELLPQEILLRQFSSFTFYHLFPPLSCSFQEHSSSHFSFHSYSNFTGRSCLSPSRFCSVYCYFFLPSPFIHFLTADLVVYLRLSQ